MRIGCTSWSLTGLTHEDVPYEEIIKKVAAMGFKGTELISFTDKFLDEYYTKKKNRQLVELLESSNLTLSEFVVSAEAVPGLAELDETEKKKGIETFRKGAQVAKELGARIINTVALWPRGLSAPVDYFPSFIHPFQRGVKYVNTQWTIEIPKDFSWPKIWENYVDSVGICTDIAEDEGLKFALEGHTHSIICHTDSFLRLFDEVKSSALGMNFDTCWQAMQREYIPISIHKLRDKVFHVHTRDTDGQLNYGLPPGQGILPWEEFLKTLKSYGYKGFISIEMGGFKEPERYFQQGREYLESVLSKLGVYD